MISSYRGQSQIHNLLFIQFKKKKRNGQARKENQLLFEKFLICDDSKEMTETALED